MKSWTVELELVKCQAVYRFWLKRNRFEFVMEWSENKVIELKVD